MKLSIVFEITDGEESEAFKHDINLHQMVIDHATDPLTANGLTVTHITVIIEK